MTTGVSSKVTWADDVADLRRQFWDGELHVWSLADPSWTGDGHGLMASQLLTAWRTTFAAVTSAILALYLSVRPEQLRIRRSHYGKPSVESPLAMRRLWYNVSHSSTVGLVALCSRADVGIDIEVPRLWRSTERFAQRILTVAEYADFRATSAEQQPRFLLESWTGKESLLKGLGVGLRQDMRSIRLVNVSPERATAKVRSGDHGPFLPWHVRYLDSGLGARVVAACACTCADIPMRVINGTHLGRELWEGIVK